MGCDIHICVEKRTDYGWEVVEGKSQWSGEMVVEGWLYSGRNYSLFAILANVRNGYGVAGVDTGDGFVPISMPRGLPDDVSRDVRARVGYWGPDGHSHSWLTLRELEEFDGEQTTKHRGVVNMEEYRYFQEHGKPDRWCGGAAGPRVMHISNAEMEAIIEGRIEQDPTRMYYTSVEWEETYRESVKHALAEIIPGLKALGGPDDVRIVFWFDN